VQEPDDRERDADHAEKRLTAEDAEARRGKARSITGFLCVPLRSITP
jgi:hypothetical protein